MEQDLHLLVAGNFSPALGHKQILNALSFYQKKFSKLINLHFSKPFDKGFCVYEEEVFSLIKRLGLSSSVHFYTPTPSSSTKRLGQADALIYVDCSLLADDIIQAQAMGLPTVNISSSCNKEKHLATANLIDKCLFDPVFRNKLTVNGYRNIADNFSHKRIEQVFLSHILTTQHP